MYYLDKLFASHIADMTELELKDADQLEHFLNNIEEHMSLDQISDLFTAVKRDMRDSPKYIGNQPSNSVPSNVNPI